MRITFKDVGQGDSIILEWTDEGKDKIGIIDCNIYGKSNPVVDHISSRGYTEIEFLILSHPHDDHFSGMLNLLNHAEQHDITIKTFAHSLFILGPDFYKYLKWVEIDSAALKDLQELITKASSLRDKNIIQSMNFVGEHIRFDLSNDIYLSCLSPSQLEAEKYMDIVSFEPEKNKKKASAAANYLSTIFKLVVGDKFYLFTSDGEPFSFERLKTQNKHKELLEKRLHICQLPHHGSLKNYVPAFWTIIAKHDDRHAVVSAGFNLKYQHPHFPVLKGFHDDGFQIHATNIVHGMAEYVEYLKQIAKTTTILDTTSELIYNYSGGEKIFEL